MVLLVGGPVGLVVIYNILGFLNVGHLRLFLGSGSLADVISSIRTTTTNF